MDTPFGQACCIIALLLLFVIAMNTSPYSGMRDQPHRQRFATELSGFAGDGQNERPIFHDIGDSAAINAHLQEAKSDTSGYSVNPRTDGAKLVPEYLAGTGL